MEAVGSKLMTVELNEIRESARQVLGELDLAALEEKTWPLVLELGWLLVSVPEEFGGLDQGLSGACALYQEMGSRLTSGPFLSSMLAIDALAHGTWPDRESWIERLTTSDFVTVPLAQAAVSIARNSTGKATVSGVASAAASADKASNILVWSADEEYLALVPLSQQGVELIPQPTWDTTRRLFDVRFKDVTVDDKLIAGGAAAEQLVQRLLTQRDFALAADAVGGANALLDMTVGYLQERKQYGRPLAMFQALKHRCADLKMLTSSAEALLLDSLARLDGKTVDAAAETMGKAAKYLACSVYAHVAEEAVQLHGGIGVTSDHSCHLFLKRALLNQHLGRRGDSYELDIAASLLK